MALKQETMKAIEIRYSANTMNFNHTSFEHELGEQVITKGEKMTVIAREENMTEEGYKLLLALYDNYGRTISRRTANFAEVKVRLAIRILTSIGKLSAEQQMETYEGYMNQLRARRDAKFMRQVQKLERILENI